MLIISEMHTWKQVGFQKNRNHSIDFLRHSDTAVHVCSIFTLEIVQKVHINYILVLKHKTKLLQNIFRFKNASSEPNNNQND